MKSLIEWICTVAILTAFVLFAGVTETQGHDMLQTSIAVIILLNVIRIKHNEG